MTKSYQHLSQPVNATAEITSLAKEYQAKGVAIIGISSNSIETHPQDGPDEMAEDAKQQGKLHHFHTPARISCKHSRVEYLH